MLIQSASPPSRGTYVEVILAHQCVTGRVIWSKGRRFGISTRERVDVSSLVPGLRAAPQMPTFRPGAAKPSLGGRAALARVHASAFDFSFMIVLALALVAAAGVIAHDTLAQPLEVVKGYLQER